MGNHHNRLIGTTLMSTHNIGFGRVAMVLDFQKSLLSRDLLCFKDDFAAHEILGCAVIKESVIIFVVFVKDNATMSLILCFENHVSYFVQN